VITLEGKDTVVETPMPAWQSWLRFAALIVPIVALGVFYSWGAVAFVLALIGCILLHELGHFLAAKRAGMKVTQFFLFFGPRVWSFRKGETEYGVRLIPLGAFVKVPGMHNLDPDVDPADEPRTFRAAPYHSRLKMAAAGSLMHFAIALVLMGIAYAAYGITTPAKTWKVDKVEAGSPAAAAGLNAGDRVLTYDGKPIGDDYETFGAYLHNHEGATVALTVQRGAETLTLRPTLASMSAVDPCRTGGYLGFRPISDDPTTKNLSVPGAARETFTQFGGIASASVGGLGKIMSLSGLKSYGKSVSSGCGTDQRFVSPIGAVKIGSLVAKSGVSNFLLFLAQANIFIGIINWVPLLPFDGGHMLIATYERIRSRAGKRYTADVSKMMPFAYAIMLLMVVLGLGNGYLDLFHLKG
jgi:membrane-associated protease RseP (regulator of RpoE activity)